MLPDELILFKLTPYLTLYDVVIFISTSKQTARMADKLLKQVTRVHVPNADKQFMRYLTVRCPNVTKLSMRCKTLLSNSVILEINKLPLTSFECIGYIPEDDDDVDHIPTFDDYDGSEPTFNLPSLKYLYLDAIGMYNFSNSPELTVIRVLHAISTHISNFRIFKKLEEVIIDDLHDNDWPNEELFELPISKIDLELSRRTDLMRRIPLKSLEVIIGRGKSSTFSSVILKDLKLRELKMPYICGLNSIIKDMPLETLILRKNSSNEGDSPLEHKSVKTLSIDVSSMELDNLEKLPNLEVLRLYNCLITYGGRVPSIKHLTLTKCNLPTIVQSMNLISLTIDGTKYPIKLCHLPKSLRTLIISNAHTDYNKFPHLPNLTKLHIAEHYLDSEHDSDSNSDSDSDIDKKGKHKIRDEAWRRMAESPIQDLRISSGSLNDSNVHYFAKTPINYLDIKYTSVTSVGLAKLRPLELRKLVIPTNIPMHHMFQLR